MKRRILGDGRAMVGRWCGGHVAMGEIGEYTHFIGVM